MKILLVFCHPDPESYGATLAQVARTSLEEAGHEVHLTDLYAEGFDPVFSLEEKKSYLPNTAYNLSLVQSHVDSLQWADGLVVCYPTWYYGPPAMLKGWLERVWLPGVTFAIPSKKGKSICRNHHVRFSLVVVTINQRPWAEYVHARFSPTLLIIMQNEVATTSQYEQHYSTRQKQIYRQSGTNYEKHLKT
jgi:NAD(P)H dehydrogenase (quinone)